MSSTPDAMFPVTLPKHRLSIFSLGGGSSSLKRMSTTKVSKSTDALSSLDSPTVLVDAPSTPFASTRTRGGLRSSFLNLLRPTLGSRRRPSSPDAAGSSAVQPATPGNTSRALTLARGRRPSDCSSDMYRSAEAAATDDDEDEDSLTGSAGSASACSSRTRSVGNRLETAAPPALPRRPPHLLEPPVCNDRPLPLLPPIPVRQPSPLLRVLIVSIGLIFTSAAECSGRYI